MAKQVAELEKPVAVEEEASQEAVTSTGDESQDRQPEKQRINLDELAEFREWKSKMDKTVAQERKERERLEQQYQQQLAKQQQELRERQLAGMDEFERAKYEAEEARREAAYWREQANLIQVQTAREKELSTIAQKFSVPREVLEEATSRAEALEMAWDYQRTQQQTQAAREAEETEERKAQREQKRQANKVDTGAGIPATPASDWERDYEKAKKSGSAAELAKFLMR